MWWRSRRRVVLQRAARWEGCDAGAPGTRTPRSRRVRNALAGRSDTRRRPIQLVIPVQAKVARPPSGPGSVLAARRRRAAGRRHPGAPGADEERPPPTSFFRKYWHIILPLALPTNTTGEPEPTKVTKVAGKSDLSVHN